MGMGKVDGRAHASGDSGTIPVFTVHSALSAGARPSTATDSRTLAKSATPRLFGYAVLNASDDFDHL